MARIPIALELYSVRHELAQDTRGTLQAVAEMGYEGVEFAGMPQNPAEELKAYLDEFGLICCGWHTPVALVQDDRLEETIRFNQTLGNRNIIIPGLPEEMRNSKEAWLQTAAFFNDRAERLAEHGMRIGYHNHSVEFQPIDGEQPWDLLFENTRPEVIMQLDTGNARHGGADILAILRKYPGRAKTVHLKPYSETEGFRPAIGDDDTPWEEVFQICETIGGTEWYIVEYESDAYPPLEAVRRCLEGLRALGK